MIRALILTAVGYRGLLAGLLQVAYPIGWFLASFKRQWLGRVRCKGLIWLGKNWSG